MTIRDRIVVLVVVLSVGILTMLGLGMFTLAEIRVNGPVYREIGESKSLIEDIVPPPMLAAESYLAVLQAHREPMRRDELSRVLEAQAKSYREHRAAWDRRSLPGALRDALALAAKHGDRFHDLVSSKLLPAFRDHDAVTAELTLDELADAYTQHRAAADELVRLARSHTSQAEAGASVLVRRRLVMVASAGLVLVILCALLCLSVVRNVAGSIRALVGEASRLSAAVRAGSLGVRGNAQALSREFRPIVEGMNRTIDEFARPFAVTAEYVSRVAKGDIPAKITERYEGDFAVTKESLNRCIDALNGVISEMDHMSKAHDAGDIDVVISTERFEGAWRTVAQGIKDMVAGHLAANQRAMTCVAEFGRGNFEAPLERFPGKKSAINTTIEQVRANLKALIADADRLAAAAVAGKLSTRADASAHQGDFRRIIEGINHILDGTVAPIQESAGVLQRLARRDLRARVEGEYQGDHARIKESVNATAEALEESLAQVAAAVEQVSSAASEIAGSSQAVAQGASEQSSSLDDTSGQLRTMAEMVKGSAANAQHADALATQATEAAREGTSAMEELANAIERIRLSTEGTTQILKDVNEIAFQTNLLALNAAVEAARAGEVGRGFAVVAEEVRSLALRSKEAAARTAELIGQAAAEAGDVATTGRHVSAKLHDIVTSVSSASTVVAEISRAAGAQVAGIDKIARAISRIGSVTQQNAASSEESSSAAAELSGQSEELAAMVGTFRFRGATTPTTSAATSTASPSRRTRAASTPAIAVSDDAI